MENNFNAELNHLVKIKSLLSDELFVLHEKGQNHDQIVQQLKEVFRSLSQSSVFNLNKTNDLLAIFEDYHDLSVAHLYHLLRDNFSKLKAIPLQSHCTPTWKSLEFTSEEWSQIKNRFQAFQDGISKASSGLLQVSSRLSDLPAVNRDEFLYFIEISVEMCLQKNDCVSSNIKQITHDLCIYRHLLHPSEAEELYLLMTNVLQSLDQDQKYQLSRTLAYDSLSASFLDNQQLYGFYLLACHYTQSFNTLQSLFYLNLCIYAITQLGTISHGFILDFYWVCLAFCRNNRYVDFGKEIFAGTSLDGEPFHLKMRFYITYMYILVNDYDLRLPEMVFSFIEDNKNEIQTVPHRSILSLYVILLSIKLQTLMFNIVDERELTVKLAFCESLLPIDISKRYYNMFFGSMQEIKDGLALAFSDLSFSTDRLNFVSQNKFAIGFANLVLKRSFE